jgi:hypothetical protein
VINRPQKVAKGGMKRFFEQASTLRKLQRSFFSITLFEELKNGGSIGLEQGCQIFLGAKYQNERKYITNCHQGSML